MKRGERLVVARMLAAHLYRAAIVAGAPAFDEADRDRAADATKIVDARARALDYRRRNRAVRQAGDCIRLSGDRKLRTLSLLDHLGVRPSQIENLKKATIGGIQSRRSLLHLLLRIGTKFVHSGTVDEAMFKVQKVAAHKNAFSRKAMQIDAIVGATSKANATADVNAESEQSRASFCNVYCKKRRHF